MASLLSVACHIIVCSSILTTTYANDQTQRSTMQMTVNATVTPYESADAAKTNDTSYVVSAQHASLLSTDRILFADVGTKAAFHKYTLLEGNEDKENCKTNQYWEQTTSKCLNCTECFPGTQHQFQIPCGRGFGVKEKCQPCPDNYYQERTGYSGLRCRPCITCDEHAMVLETCSLKRNTRCGPCPSGKYEYSPNVCIDCTSREDSPACAVTQRAPSLRSTVLGYDLHGVSPIRQASSLHPWIKPPASIPWYILNAAKKNTGIIVGAAITSCVGFCLGMIAACVIVRRKRRLSALQHPTLIHNPRADTPYIPVNAEEQKQSLEPNRCKWRVPILPSSTDVNLSWPPFRVQEDIVVEEFHERYHERRCLSLLSLPQSLHSHGGIVGSREMPGVSFQVHPPGPTENESHEYPPRSPDSAIVNISFVKDDGTDLSGNSFDISHKSLRSDNGVWGLDTSRI